MIESSHIDQAAGTKARLLMLVNSVVQYYNSQRKNLTIFIPLASSSHTIASDVCQAVGGMNPSILIGSAAGLG